MAEMKFSSAGAGLHRMPGCYLAPDFQAPPGNRSFAKRWLREGFD
jgi:hypothetical protein